MRGIQRLLTALALLAGGVAQSQAAITISTSSPAPFEFVQGRSGSPWLGINATGGTAAPSQSVCYTWTITGFSIPGLTALPLSPCSPAVVVQGTPTTLGTYNFSVSVIDGQGGNASRQISVTVVPPLAIVTQTLPDILSGVPYSAQVVVQGGLKPYQQFQCNVGHFSLSCNQGLVTGTIVSSFDTTIACGVDVRVTDRTSTVVQKCFDLRVKAAQPPSSVLKITTNALPAAVIGQPYNFQATAINVTGPPKWSAIGLPAGLMISLAGLISGTPTGPVGVVMVKLGIGDNTALTDSVTIAMAVQAAPTTPPVDPPVDPPGDPSPGDPNQKVALTTPPLLDPLVLGKFTTFKFNATNGVPPYKFTTAILTLPTGMTLNMDGTYIGAPTKAGDYQFQVTVTDARGDTETKTFTQTVFDAPRITNTFPKGEVGKPYDVQIQISGGSPPYRVQATDLPPGISFSPLTLRVTGNTTTGGTFISMFTITDANDTKATETVSITVDPAPAPLKIDSASPLPDMTLNADAMFQFAASGGKTPYAWSIVGNAIPGLTLDAATGKLSGKPALAGKQTLTVKVTDAAGTTDQKVFELTVLTPAQLSFNPGQFNIALPPVSGVPTTTFGQITNATGAENVTVTGTNGAPIAVQASLLPDGTVAVVATTPNDAPAAFQNNITITSASGQTIVVPVNLTVQKPPAPPVGRLVYLNGRPFGSEGALVLVAPQLPDNPVLYPFAIDGQSPIRFDLVMDDQEVQKAIFLVVAVGSQQQKWLVFEFVTPAASLPPGTHSGNVSFTYSDGSVQKVGVEMIVHASVPLTASLSELTVKLGSTPAQDQSEATVCVAPGATIEADPGVASQPSPVTGCQLYRTPLDIPISLKVRDAARQQTKVVIVPAETADLSCQSDSQVITPTDPPKAKCVNRREKAVKMSSRRLKKGVSVPPRTENPNVFSEFGPGDFPLPFGGFDMTVEPPQIPTGPPATQRQSILEFSKPDGIPGLSILANKFADGCVPERLMVLPRMPHPVLAKIGRPEWLRVAVYDNCGAERADAQVSVWPGSGDPSVRMAHGFRGRYSAFWTPIREAAGTQFLMISAAAGGLAGFYSAGVEITPGPAAALLEPGSVVSGASFEGGRVRAPGEFVSLFGANLAAQSVSASSVPLPTSLGGVRLELNGVPLPLLFVSAGQINAILPVGVPVNTILQLALYKGSALPVLVDLVVGAAQPAVFSRNLTGKGQGIILDPQFRFLDSGNPGKAGDPFVMYLSGLGEVEPAVPSGAAAPTTSLHRVKAPVKVTIGGIEVTNLAFAGLAPGLVGVYQLNGVIPEGVAAGNAVPVVVTAAGQSSPAVTMAIQ